MGFATPYAQVTSAPEATSARARATESARNGERSSTPPDGRTTPQAHTDALGATLADSVCARAAARIGHGSFDDEVHGLNGPPSMLARQANADNRAVARGSAPEGVLFRARAMYQPGFATGDMFAIAAALMADTELHVFITVLKPGAVADPRDNGRKIKAFYLDSGIPDNRVHLVEADKLQAGNVAGKAARTLLGITPKKVEGVNWGTQYIAQSFSAEMRNKIRAGWKVDASKDAEIKEWLSTKGITDDHVVGTEILVLWARFSGKKGEIHLEHDTSYEGVRQILARLAGSRTVIIAGDAGWTDAKRNKFNEIAAAANKDLPKAKVFNLTEFWAGAQSEELKAWGGNTRLGQFKLYDYLNRKGNVVHLGFRSGNLEALALLGHKVRYMEEPGSHGSDRMKSWHDDKTGTGATAKGGLATGYERIKVKEVPTRSGKYAKTHGEDRPTWAPGKAAATPKPNEIAAAAKTGFTSTDLDKLFTRLSTAF